MLPPARTAGFIWRITNEDALPTIVSSACSNVIDKGNNPDAAPGGKLYPPASQCDFISKVWLKVAPDESSTVTVPTVSP